MIGPDLQKHDLDLYSWTRTNYQSHSSNINSVEEWLKDRNKMLLLFLFWMILLYLGKRPISLITFLLNISISCWEFFSAASTFTNTQLNQAKCVPIFCWIHHIILARILQKMKNCKFDFFNIKLLFFIHYDFSLRYLF